MNLPQMAMLAQAFDPQHLEDIPAEIKRKLARLGLNNKVKAGDSIAITGGSRGIANIDVITKTIVEELKHLGARPFIFPAMGSHGGATDQGQIKVLENLGITETAMGCPIHSSMEVVYPRRCQ